MTKKSPGDSYSLAKGIHHINIAKQYFEDVKFSASTTAKNIFNSYIQKCDWMLNDIKGRLDDSGRKTFIQELEDSLTFDAINEGLIHLSVEQRAVIENLVNAMIKGEEIKVIDDKQ
jgi:hypothetical protein